MSILSWSTYGPPTPCGLRRGSLRCLNLIDGVREDYLGLARVARSCAPDLSVAPSSPAIQASSNPRFSSLKHGRAMRSSKSEDWWAGRDSNPQPKHYECSALTIELPARDSLRFNRVAEASSKLNNRRAVCSVLLRIPKQDVVASAPRN